MSSGSCFRAMKGWLAGCAAATAVIAAFTWIVVASASASSGDLARGSVALLFPALLVFLVICLLTGFPAAAVIWLSERFAIRSIWFFGGAGAVIGALGQAALAGLLSRTEPTFFPSLFVVAGFIAGMAYWRVAGTHAGRDASSGGAGCTGRVANS
jgi:hypothetical protein